MMFRKKSKYRKIINKTMKAVKQRFTEIIESLEFGTYIEPQHYFVSYIFETNAQLTEYEQNGLTNKIVEYHKKQLLENDYPVNGIIDCTFATQEECDEKYDGNWYYYYK